MWRERMNMASRNTPIGKIKVAPWIFLASALKARRSGMGRMVDHRVKLWYGMVWYGMVW